MGGTIVYKTTRRCILAGLSDDLNRYKGELFTKGDLSAGWKIVREILGLATVIGGAYVLGTVIFPAIGIPLSGFALAGLVGRCAKVYEQSNESDRKAIRAVFSFIKGTGNFID